MIIKKTLTIDRIRQRIAGWLDDVEPLVSAQQHVEKEKKTESNRQGMNTSQNKIKIYIRKIPILSQLAVWLYRLIKMPWRVLRNYEENQILKDDVVHIEQKLDMLTTKVLATSQNSDAAIINLGRLHQKVDALSTNIGLINQTIGTVSANVVSLHEKTDSYTLTLNMKLDNIKPIVNAGNNLLLTRVDEFIMGFPSEDIRLAAALSFASLEPGLRSLLKNIIKEDMVVIDVGAHIGLLTLIAAHNVGASGKVYCFEPTPRIYPILMNNIELNNLQERVVTYRLAVTDHKGTAKLALHQVFGHNTIFLTPDDNNVIEVETDSLDNILADVPKIDIVKIDVEGAEFLVLRGMKKLIANNPRIIIFMEFAPSHLTRAGIECNDFIKEIQSYGFIMRKVEEPSGKLLPISHRELLESFSVNLMLQREQSA